MDAEHGCSQLQLAVPTVPSPELGLNNLRAIAKTLIRFGNQ